MQYVKKNIKTVGEIFKSDRAFAGIRKTALENDIVQNFSQIFPDLKLVVQAQKIYRGSLYLKVENSVWKSELNLRKHLIIERINASFGEDIIKKIKFM